MRRTLNLLAQELNHYRKAVESRDAEVICLFISTHAAPARTFWIGALPIALNRIITQVSGTAPPSYLSVHRLACRPAASARNIRPPRAKRTWRGTRVMRVFVPQPPHCGTCARRKSDRTLTSACPRKPIMCHMRWQRSGEWKFVLGSICTSNHHYGCSSHLVLRPVQERCESRDIAEILMHADQGRQGTLTPCWLRRVLTNVPCRLLSLTSVRDRCWPARC